MRDTFVIMRDSFIMIRDSFIIMSNSFVIIRDSYIVMTDYFILIRESSGSSQETEPTNSSTQSYPMKKCFHFVRELYTKIMSPYNGSMKYCYRFVTTII